MAETNAFDNYVQERILEEWQIMERRIAICLKPKPTWMPKIVYHWLISHLVKVEIKPVTL